MVMDARRIGLMRTEIPGATTFWRVLVVALSISCLAVSPFAHPDGDTLLNFKSSLTDSQALHNWNSSVIPCNGNRANWVGVLCNQHGNIRGLRLENMGLKGMVDLNSLASLTEIRTLSFMNNTLVGPWPNLESYRKLRSVYLSYNHFSGEIPDDAFEGMKFLKKVLLTNNEFAGAIPFSLATIPRLMILRLDGNKFQGRIPEFQQQDLKRFNVSNNDLEGPIPTSLRLMDTTSFAGNEKLCGIPLEKVCGSTLNTQPKAIPLLRIAIAIMVVGLILALMAAIFTIYHLVNRRRRSERGQEARGRLSKVHNVFGVFPENQMEQQAEQSKKPEHGKLTFVMDDRERFDLHDLLRASAEVLGSGTFGSSYKVTILCDAMAVKRYKQILNSVGREEFYEHMRRLGRLRHPNLLPTVAYHYRKEEKLLISDFVDNGSLASHIHGKRNEAQPGLDWVTRLRIIKGITRGLSYLYTSAPPSVTVAHGHLKSSNVLLDDAMEPLLTDYGLLPIVNNEHSHHLMMAYKSPEFARQGRITRKTDVWCLGVVILEVLTGKFPENYLTERHERGSDIGEWVNEMIKEKRTSQVWDSEMRAVSRGELLKLLKIGVGCCEEEEERRMDLNEVVAQIEELEEGETWVCSSPMTTEDERNPSFSSSEMVSAVGEAGNAVGSCE